MEEIACKRKIHQSDHALRVNAKTKTGSGPIDLRVKRVKVACLQC